MKLTTEHGELTLPAVFSFEIEQGSTFFSEDGTKSIPTVLPATDSDLAILGWPNRLARRSRFVTSLPVSIEQGIYRKSGMLVMASASSQDVTCSIALEESEFYVKYKQMALTDLFATVVRTEYSTPADWASYLYKVYDGTPDEFRVFPVAVQGDDGYLVNNEPDLQVQGLSPLIYARRVVMEHGVRVAVPVGYGIAPFLTLKAFLRRMFSLCGYTLSDGGFMADQMLDNLVLLHSCSDVICKGRIAYSDLVPGCTVADILQWLRDKFCVQALIAPASRTVTLMTVSALLATRPDQDLTGKVMGAVRESFAASRRIVITPDTSLEGAAAAADTLPKLLQKYKTYVVYAEDKWQTMGADVLGLRAATGVFYERDEDGLHAVGTNYFRYDRENADDAEEFSPSDLMPPMVIVNGVLMPFVGERTHRNTKVPDGQESAAQGIMLCQAAGMATTGRYCYGTTQAYNDAGVKSDHLFDLSSDSLFFRYFNTYNTHLLAGAVTLSMRLQLTASEVVSWNMYACKLLDGQVMVPTHLRYEVGSRIRCMDARFLLAKSYDDVQPDAPSVIPEAALKWSFDNSEFEAWQAAHQQHAGPASMFDYEWEWTSDDPYQVMQPTVTLPEPSYLGQRSEPLHRSMQYWEIETMISGEEVRRGPYLVTLTQSYFVEPTL